VGKYKDRFFTGNSVLLEFARKYIFAGWKIQSFLMEPGDKLVQYYSYVGNSDVPYPVLLGEKNVYFMLDMKYVSKDAFPKLKKSEWYSAYAWFYGHIGGVDFSKKAQDMRNVKLVHDRNEL